MKNLLLILAGVVTVSFTACDDDDDTASMAPAATRMELITSQDWVLVSDIQTAEGRSINNIDELAPESRDDIFKFQENGQAVRDEGPTKEEGAPQIVETASWSFMESEKNLDVAFESLPIKDEIVELSKDRMVLRRLDGTAEKIMTFQAE